MESLKGKRALVTGGSQGIGRIICKTLANEGCELLVNCAHHPDKAQAVVNEIIADGGKAAVCICDITDENAVNHLFDTIGRVDILVNNARIDPYFRKPEMSNGEWWDLTMKVNVKGTYLCTQAFYDHAKEYGWGRIVNIASVRSFIPAEMNMVAYNTSKLAMHGITRCFAANGAPYNITANTICPGMVVTENITKRLTEEEIRTQSANIPLKRPATSEEIADAVLFPIKNGFVTGETININGGVYYAP